MSYKLIRNSKFLIRSLTHGDVRYEDSESSDVTDLGNSATLNSSLTSTTSNKTVDSTKKTPVASFRSMFNVSSSTSRLVNSKKDSVSSADLVSQQFSNITIFPHCKVLPISVCNIVTLNCLQKFYEPVVFC